MCFAVPYKIIDVGQDMAMIENGKKMSLGRMKAKKGDYARCVGETVIDVLSKKDGLAIRRLIASLNV